MTAEPIAVPTGMRPNVELAWVPCWEMTADHPYQRSQKPERIEDMKTKWKDHLIGGLVLVENPQYRKPRGRRIGATPEGGSEIRYWIIEGGHRHKAAMEKFGGGYLLPVIIVALDSNQDIAQTFLDINGERRGVAKRDQYTVGTNAVMEPYRSINVILEKYDLGPGHTQREHTIGALDTLVKIYNLWGGGILEQTIQTLIDAFGYMQSTWSAPILVAVADVYGINNSLVDVAHLVSVLNARDGRAIRDPKRWEMMGVEKAQSAGGSVSRGRSVCSVIVEKYNKGLPKKLHISSTRPRALSGAAAMKVAAKVHTTADTTGI